MIVGAGTVMVFHKPQPQGYKIEIIKISLSNLALILTFTLYIYKS
jgi:hypothetical protein